ncbi:hypothetical protein KBC70_01795 [Candidatus Woesebacteria bacterium]|nr:hypothetical protein [Candidatus Woesebacteria bacterium]
MKSPFLASFLAVLAIAFTTANILASQTIYKPLMFRLVTLQDADAGREFLANLEGTDLFAGQSQYLNSIFDNIFAVEIDTRYLNIEKNITEYENMLSLNPKNRDVLIKLALLYRDKGTGSALEKSRQYYAEAKAVDPWVKVEGLEKL